MGIVDYLARTMLVERMTGVAVYALLLGFFYVNIKSSNDSRTVRRLLRIYTFILCIMAFFYVPAESADLYRWRVIGEGWKSLDFSAFFDMYMLKVSTPLGYLLIYLCQKTGIDGLLPLICSFVFFHSTFYILDKETTKNDYDGVEGFTRYTAIGLLFVMCSGWFLETISGVRCMMSFAVVAKCFYCETVEKKSILRSSIPYLVACLIHSAVIPLVALRMVTLLLERNKSFWQYCLNIIILIFMAVFALRYGSSYIDASIERANGFITNNIYSYSWEYIIGVLQYLIIVVVLVKYYRLYRMRGTGLDNLAFISVILVIVELVLVMSYSIFHRYSGFSTFIAFPLLAHVLKEESQRGRYIFSRNIKLICMVILVLACLRGNLCAYKFFIL